MKQVQYTNLHESTKGHQENLNGFQPPRTEDHLDPTRCWKHKWKIMISHQTPWIEVFHEVMENFEKLRPAESIMNFESILSLWVWSSNIIRYSSGVQSSLWLWLGYELAVTSDRGSEMAAGGAPASCWRRWLGSHMSSFHNPTLPPSGKGAVVLGYNLSRNHCLFFQLDKWLSILGWLINLTV